MPALVPPKTASCLSLCVLLLYLTVPCPISAHNGAVAIAVPLEGITIDGDLSDWPEGMRTYPIGLSEYGDMPVGEQDCRASFRVGYSHRKEALYVAVEVQDESVVIDTTATGCSWDSCDGCDVYIDLGSRSETVSVTQYRIWGNCRGIGALNDEIWNRA